MNRRNAIYCCSLNQCVSIYVSMWGQDIVRGNKYILCLQCVVNTFLTAV